MGNSPSNSNVTAAKSNLTKCGGGEHIMKSFECNNADCEMSPIICQKCSFKSREQKGKRICKLCRAAEKMREIEDEDEEIDTSTSNNVQLVSSVSYDKEKRNFVVQGNLGEHYGNDQAAHFQEGLGKGVTNMAEHINRLKRKGGHVPAYDTKAVAGKTDEFTLSVNGIVTPVSMKVVEGKLEWTGLPPVLHDDMAAIDEADQLSDPLHALKIAVEKGVTRTNGPVHTSNEIEEFFKQLKINEKNPAGFYQIMKKISEDTYIGARKSDKKVFKLKIVKESSVIKEKTKLMNQLLALDLIYSKNKVSLVDCFLHKGSYFIVMEFMEAGSLQDYIDWKGESQISDDFAKYTLWSVGQTLKELHESSCIHRDLKAENIHFGKDGKIRIADFGFAAILTKEEQVRKSMTQNYPLPPEMDDVAECGKSVDIWAYGVLAYQLGTRKLPFDGQRQVEPNFTDTDIKANVTRYWQRIIGSCLKAEPDKRVTINSLLEENPFLQGAEESRAKWLEEFNLYQQSQN